MIVPMYIITDKFWIRCFFFTVLLVGSYNFLGQAASYNYVQGQFGVTSRDAAWLQRGFQAAATITSIAGLVFIKWLGNRTLFIGSAIAYLVGTIISFSAPTFNVLLTARITGGIANGLMVAVASQLFLATFEGEAKKIGALYSVAAGIGGMVLGIMANSFFTEDFGWEFSYYLEVPILVFIISCSIFFVPAIQKNEEIEEDWISLVPFSILVMSLYFLVLFREQYQGLSNIKIVLTCILAVASASVLLIRGFLHRKPLFDTRLLQYPGFIMGLLISFLGGAGFIFVISMLTKLLSGILGMPMKDWFHFMNFLALVILISFFVTVILVARKFSPYWLLITSLLAVAYSAFALSKLNSEFSFENLVTPSIIGMAGSGMIVLSVVLVAVKTVPPHQVGKVANFRGVAFSLGLGLTATELANVIDFEQVRNFNLMRAYTDPGNPLFQDRLNGLQGFYQSNGYDANQAYDAAIKGMTGAVKFQSFFLAESELLLVGCVIALALALVVFILWIAHNYQMLFNFFNFKNSADEQLQPETGKI
jgi:MFS family permease